MPKDEPRDDYEFACEALESGDAARLDELAALVESFPRGCDDFLGRRWITNAIDIGALASVRWLLERGVELRFRDLEGYTPVLSAIERNRPDRHAVLRLVLAAGADVDGKGINDYTPAHLAAVRNDVESLRILVEAGADLSIRTDIDSCTTALGEAMYFDRTEAVAYLRSVGCRLDGED